MTTLNRRTLLGSTAAVGTSLAFGSAPALASPSRLAPGLIRSGRPVLTHGIQAGDAVHGAATLWSRADGPARLVAEISRDDSFRHARTVLGPVVRANSDFTGQIRVPGLPSGTDLFYRITAVPEHGHGAVSEPLTGRFRTGATGRKDIRFIWSGDIAGQGYGVNPDLGGYRIADAMRAADADFFLSSGDNCYSDGPVVESVTLPDGRIWRNLVTEEKSQVAQTLDQYRGQFKYNLLADNWRAFLSETAIVAQWDDHEVLNNWYPGEILVGRAGFADGTAVDPLAARARRAFHEYIPVGDASPDSLGRVYRKLSYGPLMDLFILDMRTYKDPNTTDVETVDDGGILGREQTEWFLREIKRSTATWKVIANDLPLGLVVPDGTHQESISQGDGGAPLGREIALGKLLTELKRAGIRNHVWLTADVHYTAAHHYSPDRATYQDFDEFWEFVSGPLNAGAFGPNALDATFGPEAVFVAAPPRASASPLEGYQFFGQVDIDARSQQLTVTLKDVDGKALFTKTLDPARR
ncbi:alkaline phosphatase D family protein [Nocardioides sp. Kera G14]|uniref:alkaline phosphatase D family protein n=1 Tax=Nocardioides sp. Kera G14 TaxID=2884264 RepID=UPI001D1102FF|nr:alkaline phosphatase D family protein [Nocardioides sp. Kera G14]UDY24814.1 alkaline phosphatase D family protein [Nocardioides sp. Kera G14]